MKRLLFFLIILGMVFGLKSPGFSRVILEKRDIRIEIKPGEKSTGSLLVSNNSTDEDLTVKAYFEDFVYAPPYNGIKEFIPLGSIPRSCAGWVSVTPETFVLPRQGDQAVTYAINVPADAKGGYYAVLFFETGTGEAEGPAAVGVKLRTGSSFYLETKDKIIEPKIEKFSGGRKGTIDVSFTNAGNVVLVTNSNFSVKDDKGKVLDKGELKTIFLPPGEKTVIKVKPLPKVLPGKYTLLMNFDFGRGGRPLTKEVEFSKSEMGHIKIIKVKE